MDGYPDCHYIKDLLLIANRYCNGSFYDTKEYGWDSGDCTVDGYPDCHLDGIEEEEIGDSKCNGGM